MEKLLKANGYNIEVFDNQSQGQVIVFVHGLGGNYKQWLEQIDYFTGYRIIAISLQGHGGSDHPDQDEAYTMKAYGDIVVDIIDQLELKDITWVGNSMGGVVGYEVLKRRPDVIKKLITNGTTPRIKMGKLGRGLIMMMDKILIKLMSFEGYTKFAAKHSSYDKEAQEKVHKLFMASSPKTIISSHQVLGWYDYLDIAQKCEKPIYIIESPLDKEINKYIKAFKSSLNKIKFITFEGTGHICNLEKPKAYNEILKGILDEN